MKNKLLTALFLTGAIIMGNGCTTAQETGGAPDYLDEKEILFQLKKTPYKPIFPPASDRKAWLATDAGKRQALIRAAEKNLKTSWPLLTARDYMLFRRSNSRKAYETPAWSKRHKLVSLVLAECCEYSGRFMDEIIEGLWQILSEPVWCPPAHEGLPEGELFPDPSRFKVDIFSSSTGRMLCDTLILLEPELTKISPFLVQRVKMEVMRRIVEPAEKLNEETAWWFSGRNNWTPWCAANLTGCAIYLLKDQPERLAKFINTYLGISRRFYNRYPADGGCNEGPTYWRHAPGKYIQLLNLLDHRLGMGGKVFSDAKLLKMCEYLPGMNLSGNWFLSTNDAAPRLYSEPQFLFYVAQKVNSPSLMALAQRLQNAKRADVKVADLESTLITLFTQIPDVKLPAALPAVNHWENLGISILREKTDKPEKGTVVSLKGGNNAESHNHFDLGHFTLMRCNKPLIVDVGSGVYTAVTFSANRYTLWNNNSTGHNAPRFSGMGQDKDAKYTAQITVEGDSVTKALMDNAYPESAGVTALTRTLTLDRKNGNVEVCDTVQVNEKKKIEITLFTAVQPEKISDSCIQWPQGKMTVEKLKVVSVVEENRLDEAMKRNWKKLWRIELTGEVKESGSWKLKFDFSK